MTGYDDAYKAMVAFERQRRLARATGQPEPEMPGQTPQPEPEPEPEPPSPPPALPPIYNLQDKGGSG